MSSGQARPASVAAFRARVSAAADALPRRLRQCAEHVLAHDERIAVSTVAEMAAGAGAPPSAFMRFCQAMGFSGYSELQRLYREAHAGAAEDYAARLAALRCEAESPAALVAEFAEAGRRSLEALTRGLDAGALERAVARLAAAPMIHVVGLRRAYPVAAYLAYAFDRMGAAAALHDGAGMALRREAVREGDALIAVSFRPYSAETIAMAEAARARGAGVVALTDAPTGPLRQPAHETLIAREAEFGAFRALSAAMTLATALAVAVGARREACANRPVE